MPHPLVTLRAILLGLLTLVWIGACASPAPSAAPPAATTSAATPAPAAKTTSPASPVPAATAAPANTAPAGGTPRRGGTAVIVVDADPETLNPGITTSNVTGDIQAKVFEGLVWLDQNGAPQPALATSWQISPDGLTYTFKLRPNVKWHDGRDFTSADVKYTFEEILVKFHPRTSTTFKRLELKVDAPDPQTAVLTLKQPYAPLLIQMSVFETPIMPMHLYQGTDPSTNPANQAPVGTGPFKFAAWNRGTNVKVVRNDQYWESGKPYLDSVIFQVVPQGPNRSTGLETGELDFVLDFYLPKADVGRLSGNTNLISKRGQGAPAIDFLMINLKHPVLANKQVRQALAFAIKRETQVQQAMGGLGRPGYGAFGDGFRWLVNPDVSYDKLYAFNADTAKQMLGSAGVPANTTLRLTYDAARPNFVAGAQIIKDNLRQVGVNVDLQPLERTVMIDKVFTQKDFDLTLQSYFSSGDPSIGYHRLYLTNTGSAPFVNASGYSSPQVDDLLARASTAPTQEERAPIYKQLETILNDDLPALILYDESGVDFATRKLNGLWTSIDSRNRWDMVWLSQ
jgi:peptide/nickel transport system substrate-binding protein